MPGAVISVAVRGPPMVHYLGLRSGSMDGTLDYYDENSEEYSEKTFGADVSGLRDRFLSYVPHGGRILDLGCGSGRDSSFFLNAGYEVTAIDGSAGMCRIASKNAGIAVRRLQFSQLDYVEEFDGVWACSSLLHVPSCELPSTISLVRRSLKPGGVIFASFRLGDFEGDRDGRHYTDLDQGRLSDLFSRVGFEVIDTWESLEKGRGMRWCNGLFRKRPSDVSSSRRASG